jgi:hypothetical protein
MAFVRLHARTAVARAARTRPFALRRRPRRLTTVALGLAGALMVLLPSCAGGQSWRTLDVARQLPDSAPVAVKVQYAAGRLTLRGAEAPYLYRMQLRYNEERAKSVSSWDVRNRTLTVGLENSDVRFSTGKRSESGEMTLALARTVPMDLSVELGATESTLDLSGLRLKTLLIHAGASETKVRFDAATSTPMERMEVDAGAAAFHAAGIANSGVAKVIVNGGLGLVDLDFGGIWKRDIALDLTLNVGGAELTVPSDVGIHVSGQKTLGSYEFEGMRQVAPGVWETTGFSEAKHKLTITATTNLGSLKIVRR